MLFISSKSLDKFKMKFNPIGYDFFSEIEKDYTKLVASNQTKFLKVFKDPKRGVFGFKKYLNIPIQVNNLTKIRSKPKLLWSVRRVKKGDLMLKVAVNESDDGEFIAMIGSCKELKLENLDLEAVIDNIMIYELATGF